MSGWLRSPAPEYMFQHFLWTLLQPSPSSLTFLSHSLLAICNAPLHIAFLYHSTCIILSHSLFTLYSLRINHVATLFRRSRNGFILPTLPVPIPSSSRKPTTTHTRIGWYLHRRPFLPRRTLRPNRRHQRLSKTWTPFGCF